MDNHDVFVTIDKYKNNKSSPENKNIRSKMQSNT